MSTVAERVAAGAAFMDEHDPGWWRADIERPINLSTLDLWQGADCILGQRCPAETLARYIGSNDEDELSEMSHESFAAYAIGLSGLSRYTIYDWAWPFGFTAYSNGTEWEELTAEWARVITERRSTS